MHFFHKRIDLLNAVRVGLQTLQLLWVLLRLRNLSLWIPFKLGKAFSEKTSEFQNLNDFKRSLVRQRVYQGWNNKRPLLAHNLSSITFDNRWLLAKSLSQWRAALHFRTLTCRLIRKRWILAITFLSFSKRELPRCSRILAVLYTIMKENTQLDLSFPGSGRLAERLGTLSIFL